MNSPLVQRMQPFGTSIFAEMTQRALAADAVNLGQGAPDSGTPPQLIEWAHEAMVKLSDDGMVPAAGAVFPRPTRER